MHGTAVPALPLNSRPSRMGVLSRHECEGRAFVVEHSEAEPRNENVSRIARGCGGRDRGRGGSTRRSSGQVDWG
jgi:hypothetical protein